MKRILIIILALLIALMSVIAVKYERLKEELDKEKQVVKSQTHFISKQLYITKKLRHDLEQQHYRERKLGEEIIRLKTVRARVTAYAPLDNKSGICAEGNPLITSTGETVGKSIIAVDPKKIPYGTKVEIPGYGVARASDTGGALRNYDGIAIDVYKDSYIEAMKWGVKYIDVIIDY